MLNQSLQMSTDMSTMQTHRPIQALPSSVITRLRSSLTTPSIAHCVEELVLNSLDAQATHIAVRVDLESLRVQVVDNGCGIVNSDLKVVGQRYSTSKCYQIEDLGNLAFFGFRGEFLASLSRIASVLEIVTRPKDEKRTFTKLFRKGKVHQICESRDLRPTHGTTVSAYNVYYNLPVRQKSINAALDLERIRKCLESLAIIHHHVSFSLRDDCTGSKIIQTHCTKSMKTALGFLFGHTKSNTLREVKHTHKNFTVKGYVGVECHTNKSLQFVYVNKKPVQRTKLHKLVNKYLSHSLLTRPQRYENDPDSPVQQELLSLCDQSSLRRAQGEYPVYILDISCLRSEYDILSDPLQTFLEFQDWGGVTFCVEKALHKFLVKENLCIGVSENVEHAAEAGKSLADDSDDEETLIELVKSASPVSPTNLKKLQHFGYNISTTNLPNNLQSKAVTRAHCDAGIPDRNSDSKTKDGSPIMPNLSETSPNNVGRSKESSPKIQESTRRLKGSSTVDLWSSEEETNKVVQDGSESVIKSNLVRSEEELLESKVEQKDQKDCKLLSAGEPRQWLIKCLDQQNKSKKCKDVIIHPSSLPSSKDSENASVKQHVETVQSSESLIPKILSDSEEIGTDKSESFSGMLPSCASPVPLEVQTVAETDKLNGQDKELLHLKHTHVKNKNIEKKSANAEDMTTSSKIICPVQSTGTPIISESNRYSGKNVVSSSTDQVVITSIRDVFSNPVREVPVNINCMTPVATSQESLPPATPRNNVSNSVDVGFNGTTPMYAANMSEGDLKDKPDGAVQTEEKTFISSLHRFKNGLKCSPISIDSNLSTPGSMELVKPDSFGKLPSNKRSVLSELRSQWFPDVQLRMKPDQKYSGSHNSKMLSCLSQKLALLRAQRTRQPQSKPGQDLVATSWGRKKLEGETEHVAQEERNHVGCQTSPHLDVETSSSCIKARESYASKLHTSLARKQPMTPPLQTQNDSVEVETSCMMERPGLYKKLPAAKMALLEPLQRRKACPCHFANATSSVKNVTTVPVRNEELMPDPVFLSTGSFVQTATDLLSKKEGRCTSKSEAIPSMYHEERMNMHNPLQSDETRHRGDELPKVKVSHNEKACSSQITADCRSNRPEDKSCKEQNKYEPRKLRNTNRVVIGTDGEPFGTSNERGSNAEVSETSSSVKSVSNEQHQEFLSMLEHSFHSLPVKAEFARLVKEGEDKDEVPFSGYHHTEFEESLSTQPFSVQNILEHRAENALVQGSLNTHRTMKTMQNTQPSHISACSLSLKETVPEKADVLLGSDCRKLSTQVPAPIEGQQKTSHTGGNDRNDDSKQLNKVAEHSTNVAKKHLTQPASEQCTGGISVPAKLQTDSSSISVNKLLKLCSTVGTHGKCSRREKDRKVCQPVKSSVDDAGLSPSCEEHTSVTSTFSLGIVDSLMKKSGKEHSMPAAEDSNAFSSKVKNQERTLSKACSSHGCRGERYASSDGDLSAQNHIPSSPVHQEDNAVESSQLSQETRNVLRRMSDKELEQLTIIEESSPEVTSVDGDEMKIQRAKLVAKSSLKVKEVDDVQSSTHTQSGESSSMVKPSLYTYKGKTYSEKTKVVLAKDYTISLQRVCLPNSSTDGEGTTGQEHVLVSADANERCSLDGEATKSKKTVTFQEPLDSRSQDNVTGWHPPVILKRGASKTVPWELYWFLPKSAQDFFPVKPQRGQAQAEVDKDPDEMKLLIDQHLMETDQEDIARKWREGPPRETRGPLKSIDDLFDNWKNPIFETGGPEVLNATQALSATVKVHNSLHPYHFTKEIFNSIQIIGQLDNKFVVCLVNSPGRAVNRMEPNLLVLVDQHAAHERIRLEQLTHSAYMTSDDGISSSDDDSEDSQDSRCLRSTEILPLNIHITPDECRLAQAYCDKLERFGVTVSVKSRENRLRAEVTALPSCLLERETNSGKRAKQACSTDLAETLVQECVHLLQETAGSCGVLPKTIIKSLNLQACRGAIKFGDPLDHENMVLLLSQLAKCDLPFQCAHGRPSIIPLLDMNHLYKKLNPQDSEEKPSRPNLSRIWRKLDKKSP